MAEAVLISAIEGFFKKRCPVEAAKQAKPRLKKNPAKTAGTAIINVV